MYFPYCRRRGCGIDVTSKDFGHTHYQHQRTLVTPTTNIKGIWSHPLPTSKDFVWKRVGLSQVETIINGYLAGGTTVIQLVGNKPGVTSQFEQHTLRKLLFFIHTSYTHRRLCTGYAVTIQKHREAPGMC